MRKMSKTSLIGWFMLISAVGMGLELLFNWWLSIPLIIGVFLVITGKRHKNKGSANVFLIIGLSLIAIAILSSGFFRFFVFAAVIYGLHEYSKSKKIAQKIIVDTIEPEPKSRLKESSHTLKICLPVAKGLLMKYLNGMILISNVDLEIQSLISE